MAEPISLDAFRKKKEGQQPLDPNSETQWGKLVWLFCPVCETIEYSEVVAPNGRSHKCGTQVEEVEVELDLRAEAYMTHSNLKAIEAKIKELQKSKLLKLSRRGLLKALTQLKASEEVYLNKLQMAAHGELLPYVGSLEDVKEKLQIEATDPLGIMISPFRFDPFQRFRKRVDLKSLDSKDSDSKDKKED
ncbi:MAG: hypothetical protein QNL04_11925 [SAR324 cluster bacterium]|nr:hypothetical protein [SAR324 cluster bacterium]